MTILRPVVVLDQEVHRSFRGESTAIDGDRSPSIAFGGSFTSITDPGFHAGRSPYDFYGDVGAIDAAIPAFVTVTTLTSVVRRS